MKTPIVSATGRIVVVSTPKTGQQPDAHRGYVVAEADPQKAVDMVAHFAHSGEKVEDLGAISGKKVDETGKLPGKVQTL